MHSLQHGDLSVAQPLPETAALFHLQAFLVGIVVPDSEVMPGWAKKRGFDGTYSELCKNKVCFCICRQSGLVSLCVTSSEVVSATGGRSSTNCPVTGSQPWGSHLLGRADWGAVLWALGSWCLPSREQYSSRRGCARVGVNGGSQPCSNTGSLSQITAPNTGAAVSPHGCLWGVILPLSLASGCRIADLTSTPQPFTVWMY